MSRLASLEKVIYSRDFVVSHVSWHFLQLKVPETGKMTKSLDQGIFFKGYCCFSCFQHFFVIKSVQKQEKRQNLLRKSFIQGTLLFLMFLDIFCNKRCLETGETLKYFEQAIFFKGYRCFSCFRNFFVIKSVQKQENPLKLMIFSRALVVFLFLDTFESRKWL